MLINSTTSSIYSKNSLPLSGKYTKNNDLQQSSSFVSFGKLTNQEFEAMPSKLKKIGKDILDLIDDIMHSNEFKDNQNLFKKAVNAGEISKRVNLTTYEIKVFIRKLTSFRKKK